MAKKKKEEGFNPLGWMFTFSDLVTLLLTFFVMLLSMKQPEVTKLKAVFGIFAHGSEQALGFSDRGEMEQIHQLLDQLKQPSADEMQSPDQELAISLELPGSTQPELVGPLQTQLKIRRDERGTIITLANDLLFNPGQAELSPRAREAIRKVADLIRYGDQAISVEGHTDSTKPGSGAGFTDNWELSLARALAVLDQLVAVGGIRESRLKIAALADTRPVAANDTPEHRALNRRTEIILLKNEF